MRSSSVSNCHNCTFSGRSSSHYRGETVSTILAVLSRSASGTILSICTVLTIQDGERVRTSSVGNRHDCSVSGRCSSHCGRNTVSAIGTVLTGGTWSTWSTMVKSKSLGSTTILGDSDLITCSGRHHHKRWHIGSLGCIQSVGYAQQLLNTCNVVVETTCGINFRFQEIRTIGPVDRRESPRHGATVTHLHRHQAVSIGVRLMGFDINGSAAFASLQNRNLHSHILVHYQVVVRITNHCLISHFLRCLCPQHGCGKHHH